MVTISKLYADNITHLEGQFSMADDRSKRRLFQLEQKQLTLSGIDLASGYLLDDPRPYPQHVSRK